MERARRFSEARYISLETYRKTGAPVLTTVWVVEDAGTVYVRTGAKSGKIKRIRRNPHVRIVPTSLRGKTLGEWEDGVARFVEPEQSGRVKELFRKKYGLQIRLLGWLARIMRTPQLNPVFIGIEQAAG
jgi:PPOX class probable F420-dependent enzyme